MRTVREFAFGFLFLLIKKRWILDAICEPCESSIMQTEWNEMSKKRFQQISVFYHRISQMTCSNHYFNKVKQLSVHNVYAKIRCDSPLNFRMTNGSDNGYKLPLFSEYVKIGKLHL